MDQSSPRSVASARNYCDRIDILDAIIHDKESPLDTDGITDLLDRWYPSFVRLCEELRGDLRTVRVQSKMTTTDVTFNVVMSDQSQRTYVFDDYDEDIDT